MVENKGIGVSNLPNLLHANYRKQKLSLNIMVAGSHGLGKTTFLNKLLGKRILSYNPFDQKNGNKFWHLESKCNIAVSTLEIIENEFVVDLNLIEVDGIGDSTDNTNSHIPAIEFMESRFEDYMEKFKNNIPMLFDDKRVHMCFYFLEPVASIKAADILALQKISQYCTVIPILGKSDLINANEIQKVKSTIQDILKQNNIAYFKDYETSEEAPFLIFNDTRENIDSGSEELLRDSSYHAHNANDFLVIKRLIIEKKAHQLIQDTDQFYDKYRVNKYMSQFGEKEYEKIKERIENKIKDYQSQIHEVERRLKQATSENISQ